LSESERNPGLRVVEFEESVTRADPLLRRGAAAKHLFHELLGFARIAYHMADVMTARADPAEADIDSPVSKEVRTGIEPVGPKMTFRRIAGFEPRGKRIEHPCLPFADRPVKKTVVCFTASRLKPGFQILLAFSSKTSQ
jgi:hypothetical protein